MFFEQDQILTVLNCSKCINRIDEPRLLPCGNTVCNDCITTLTVSRNPNSNMFECAMCLNEHMLPNEEFPLNKSLLTQNQTALHESEMRSSCLCRDGHLKNQRTNRLNNL